MPPAPEKQHVILVLFMHEDGDLHDIPSEMTLSCDRVYGDMALGVGVPLSPSYSPCKSHDQSHDQSHALRETYPGLQYCSS